MIQTLETLRSEAQTLAGDPNALSQRATVYWHIYRHSNGRHTFPLLAAHGALWGAGFFATGQKLGRVLTVFSSQKTEKRARLQEFSTAYKRINARVCVETYASYYLTAQHGAEAAINQGLDPDLAYALSRCHDPAPFTPNDKRALFKAFFLWEQNTLVQAAIEAAGKALDWRLAHALAMRPAIGFRYFPTAKRLWFRNFSNKAERIRHGLAAFDIAQKTGWDHVEQALANYDRLPPDTLKEPDAAFATLRRSAVIT